MPEFQFTDLNDFLAMGGYALYVWATYLLFVLFILFNLVPPLLAQRKTIKQHRAKLVRAANHQAKQAESTPNQQKGEG